MTYPRRLRQPRKAKLAHEIIGRAALALIGLALLWGSWSCFRTARDIQRDFNDRAAASGRTYSRSTSGSGVPFAIGVVLLLLGSPVVFTAVVPIRVMEKVLGRQNNTTLWQNPEGAAPFRHLDTFL